MKYANAPKTTYMSHLSASPEDGGRSRYFSPKTSRRDGSGAAIAGASIGFSYRLKFFL